MLQIDPLAADALKPELISGESLIWVGRPTPGSVFHKEDLYLIPFSLMWGGFAIFWEASVMGLWEHGSKNGTPWKFGVIWGIPFVVIGQYMIWGRFLFTAWKKQRTFYAVTNRRVIAVQIGWNRQITSAFIDSLPALLREIGSGGIGNLRFNSLEPTSSRRKGWDVWDRMALGEFPAFIDVEDVDALYHVVGDLRGKADLTRRMG